MTAPGAAVLRSWAASRLSVAGAVGLCALALASAACPGSASRAPDGAGPQAKAPEPFEVADLIYEGGLKDGWHESGSAERDLAGGPAKVKFGDSGEWILSRPGLSGRFGGIVFRVKEPPGEGEFLEVRFASDDGRAFPKVKLKPDHRTSLGDGWTQVFVPMAEVNPEGRAFDRVVFHPFRPAGADVILLDKIALAKVTSGVPPATSPGSPGVAGKAAHSRVACDGKSIPISPFIYGIAGTDKDVARLGATARRWGGNPTSRYNWEGNFWNTANDWFFENHTAPHYGDFLSENAAHGTQSVLTVPTIGWVAKDASSYSFPVSVFGPQAQTDQWHPDVGNGVSKSGSKIAPGPATRTSVPAPPAWVKRWISAIHDADAKAGKRSVYEYILDNEPMLWNETHRDVHPEPLGYDELLERTIQYATVIRQADPEALIAGPAEFGWTGYFYSAKDKDFTGSYAIHADRRAHGDVPLVEWYLAKLREHEQKTGQRLLDVFDLHFYPQESNVYGGGTGGTDRDTQLLRLRSTRGLWDPKYVDESWIKDTIRLLPRMKEWVDKNYPGRGISIGEWNFGGEKDITGALATAEALGRFAQFGVTSAFYWTAPPEGSMSTFGFLAYRNFDGHGGRFLDSYVPSTTLDGGSVFASRDAAGKHLVIVAINMSPEAALAADIDVTSCGLLGSQQAYVYSRDGSGFVASDVVQGGTSIQRTLPPWSITVIDAHLGDTAAGTRQ